MGRLTRSLLLVLGAVAAAGASAASGEARPERVVSLNLCADELVLALADRAQIRSVTWLVADPDASWSASAARGIPINYGTAAEIIGMNPDLVIAGVYTTRTAVALFERFELPVIELAVPATLDEVRDQIRTVAAGVGHPERGASMIEAMDARLAALGPPPAGPRPVGAVYEPNGFLTGPGTLVDDVLRHAGIDNLAARRALPSFGALPLEMLITTRPDLLIMNAPTHELPSLAHQILRHPALEQAFTAPATVTVPSQAWNCGTPNVVDAVERLRNAARDWRSRSTS